LGCFSQWKFTISVFVIEKLDTELPTNIGTSNVIYNNDGFGTLEHYNIQY